MVHHAEAGDVQALAAIAVAVAAGVIAAGELRAQKVPWPFVDPRAVVWCAWHSLMPTSCTDVARFLLLVHATAGKVPLIVMDEGVLLPQGCRGCADQLAEV